MKNVILATLALFAAAAVAQNQPAAAPQKAGRTFTTNLVQRDQAPSYSDLYCSGFMTNESISHTNLITGGEFTPEQTAFVRDNAVFVGGGGMQVGSEYAVIRELKDPNHFEAFSGQRAARASVGQAYADLGHIKILAIRGNQAVANVEFSCQSMTAGDIVVPFKERPPVAYKKSASMERFPAGPGKVSARIVMAQEFDTEVGPGQKVYIDAGSNKGVKVGDYFRAVRSYDPARLSGVDSLSYKAPVGEDTQKMPGSVTTKTAKELPPRNVGEMIVLNVTPTSATAMITSSLEDILVGDGVELEESEAQNAGQ
ncbi:MAG TPA: hypothetical protein VG897_01060 [Terriglobales bacterium]|nr:hypothetical protein [Terriglobales bacterium]